jgi:protein-L-isoaspartate(D-aspartate) O-methyltransferase
MALLEEHRRFFAQLVVHGAGSAESPLIAAFSQIAREDFLEAGPWWVCAGAEYLRTPDADPRWLYQDVLVGLDPQNRINNGQPSMHAQCLAASAPREGDSVIHVGAGTGYYTAILAHLVGSEGSVLAFERDRILARRASANLERWPNVELRAQPAVTLDSDDTALPAADVIYVNAGVADLPTAWLDALKPGGRLVVPLTPDDGYGLLLQITRTGTRRFSARGLGRAGFTPCIGTRDTRVSRSLAHALGVEGWREIRSLVRGDNPDASAWCRGRGWWLSRSPPEN